MSALMLWTLLMGCGGEATEAPVDAEPVAEEAVEEAPSEAVALAELAKAVSANPDGRADLLEKAGFTDESFQQALYDVAADPAKAAEYAKAYGE